MPWRAGRVFMVYSSVRKPGASIVSQPMRPGTLKRLTTDVLPMPYHEMSHCKEGNYSGPRV